MAKTPVKVEYTRYPGIVIRIIEDKDWDRLGTPFPTIEFSTEQGYAKDATDWPQGVIDYFKTDDEFTVTVGDKVVTAEADNPPAPASAGTPAAPPSGATG